MLTIGIVTTFLVSSCRGIKPLRPQIRYDVSFQFNRCRVKCFNPDTLKDTKDTDCNRYYKREDWPNPIPDYFELEEREGKSKFWFKGGNYTLEQCDDLVGIKKSDYAIEIRPYVRKVKRACESE